MRIRKTATALLFVAIVVPAVLAGPVDDARRLYREGDYAAVVEKLRPVVKRSPKDGNANYFLGASLLALGLPDQARGPLTVAEGRGVAEASRMLAELDLERYDAAGAREHLEKWNATLRKGKKDVPESYDRLSAKAIQLGNMLERVEKIEILDSISVDSALFFNAYRLSPEAGRILPPEAVSRLGAGKPDDVFSTAYMPENRSEILWAAADSSGVYRLYGADILDDGTIDHTAVLDEALGDGASARYPFLMPDGMTLYYASDGNGSLGGYDIYMTRRSDSGDGDKEYFQGQNMGLPYNSPYNDFMLAIDETSGLGWWATDRNQIPGMVTVYVFAPSSVRVNADPSDPYLAALARLSDISLTRREGVDYDNLLASRLPAADSDGNTGVRSPRFVLDLGNGKVYYNLSDFHNERARSAMLDALGAEATLRKHLAAEEALRERYRRGDKGVGTQILESEQQTDRLRRRVKEQRNAAVRQETARR